MSRPPLLPFTEKTAIQKVLAAEDAWNTRDPSRVVLDHPAECRWPNRVELPNCHEESQVFLTRRWVREMDYRLITELRTFAADRIAAGFAYEYHEDGGNWFRAYDNENWRIDADGLMAARFASINENPIAEAERHFRWPLGRRPDDHPGLSGLGL